MTPPCAFAASIPAAILRIRSSPATKRGLSVSSTTGKTWRVISVQIAKTR